MFFHAIKKIAPEVLSSLAQDVLPVYLKLYRHNEKRKQHYLMEWKYLDISQLDDRSKAGALLDLRRALYQWSNKFLLKDEWCRDAALQTLNVWACSAKRSNTGLDWAYKPEGAKVIADELPFTFEYPEWDFNTDSWDSYKKRAMEAIKSDLMRYRDRMIRRASDSGRKPFTEKREALHFEMLAGYHIQGWTQGEIAAKYKYKDGSSIAHIIPKLARRIGLTLRQGWGRPSKK
jgi:hypothetical protein